MRLTLSLAALCALVVAVTATSTPTSPVARFGNTGLNPPRSVLNPDYLNQRSAPAPRAASAVVPARELTNAERLRRGLPPRAPINLRRTGSRLAKRSALPGVTICGYILVKSSQDYHVFGYLSPSLNDFGQTAYMQTSTQGALKFDLTYYPDDPSAPVNLRLKNSPAVEDYLGGVSGYASSSDDLAYGSTDYMVIGPVAKTPARSPPIHGDNAFGDATSIDEAMESAIWRYAYGQLSVQWVNTDGSLPTTRIGYVQEEPMFILSADLPAFVDDYGVGTPVFFTFVLA
ncbi:hypothetical protein FB451DRAFT_1403972 [Mycena latifolia]|nr:hypothetical protein FB451DRAFT_1403972 [Mycena latifolia]